jgi:hypothetical protein
MDIHEHIKEVTQWLDENVQVFATPGQVTLARFEIDPDKYQGRFEVQLDGVAIHERFRFSLGNHGHPDVHLPMFHSPLGAPASYTAVELCDATRAAIVHLLARTLPSMKPLGYNRATGECVYLTTHATKDRVIDPAAYAAAMQAIAAEGFSVSSAL